MAVMMDKRDFPWKRTGEQMNRRTGTIFDFEPKIILILSLKLLFVFFESRKMLPVRMFGVRLFGVNVCQTTTLWPTWRSAWSCCW